MRLLTLFKLRSTIPLILVLYSLVLGIIFLQSHLSWVNTNIEEEGYSNLRVSLTQTQRTLEYFLLRDDITTVQQNISILSLNPKTLHAYLVCDKGSILAASHLGNINKTLTTVAHSLSSQEQELLAGAPQQDMTPETHTSQIRLNADRTALLSATTLALPANLKDNQHPDTLKHGHRHATLYLFYDLQVTKIAARQAIIGQVLRYSLFLALLALLLWSYFHFILSRRITSLSNLANQIGQGNYTAQSNITGNDELADLARSFEEMRDSLVRSFETIRHREETLRETQAIAHMGSWELDTASKQLWWSEETYRIFNADEKEPLTFERFLNSIHPEDRAAVEKEINRSINQATGVSLDYRIIIANKARYLHEKSNVVVDEMGRVIKRKGSVQDITERREAELAMERSLQEWGVAMDASDDVIYLLDPDRHLIRANRRFYQLINSTPESALGRHIVDLTHPHDKNTLCPVCKAQEERRDALITMEPSDAYNPSDRPLQVTLKMVRDKEGQIISMLVTTQDLTTARQELEARTTLEKQLQQAQKMEAVGTLAGGIAHDFNNILTPIIGYTELALATLQPESETAQDLTEVLQAGRRAKDLVNQILTFSRQGDEAQQPLEMQLVIKEALKLLRASIPTTITFKANIDEGCAPVMASPTQIHQIIMNLCTNAYHAMRETGGELTVTLSQRPLAPQDMKDMADLRPGDYVLLEVSDNGHGMSAEVAERIFDPYFTTKAKGEGTGLGLSVVHGIIKNLAGHISVTSNLGQGSTFRVHLPVAQETAGTTKESDKNLMPGGLERIMIVDDEEAITRLHQQVLANLGYQVTTFTSPEMALHSFRAQPHDFDMLITDMTMPHLNGVQLTKEILALRPELPIIMCTGYSSLISPEEAAEIGICKFMMKPVNKSELAQAIREVLDRETV